MKVKAARSFRYKTRMLAVGDIVTMPDPLARYFIKRNIVTKAAGAPAKSHHAPIADDQLTNASDETPTPARKKREKKQSANAAAATPTKVEDASTSAIGSDQSSGESD